MTSFDSRPSGGSAVHRHLALVQSGRANRALLVAIAVLGLAACQDMATAPSNTGKTADAWRTSRPADADQMDKIASQPVARWFGNWNSDILGDVAAAVS